MTASHPLVVTIFMAAESFTDMNKWISKLSEAAEPCELINAKECYSEGSDQDADECVATSCSLNSEQEIADSENGDVPQPLGESSPCTSTSPASPTSENRRRSTLEGRTLSRNRRGRASSEGGERLSWLEPAGPDGASLPPIHVGGETEDEDVHEKPADEMESLYNDLKAASLSPIGQSSRRDFRESFVRRCQNDKVNDKLHLLRILQSTLKAKESELLALEQILTAPALAAPTYRKWRLSNAVVLQEIAQRHQEIAQRHQEIAQRHQAAGGAAQLG
ncbi:interactor protein for cytohesin exchange factors 1-like [Perca fluviatilis]|nr:interactor protein for cytohesin exchange factors 1-like [Perca fluviatilis]